MSKKGKARLEFRDGARGTALRHAAPVFAALGDRVRLALVARLGAGVPLSITQLSESLPMTRQAVTKHLHVLEDAGLASSTRAGRERKWALYPESIDEAQRCLNIIAGRSDSALQRLKAFVER